MVESYCRHNDCVTSMDIICACPLFSVRINKLVGGSVDAAIDITNASVSGVWVTTISFQ